jgi:uncharacterized protein YrzB (UPF0473 family)
MDKELKNDVCSEEHGDCCCHEEHDNHEECGCGCGCGENEALIVDLEDENGNIVSCEIVDQFTYKENDYVLVQNPEDGSVYLFKVVGEGEEGELVIPDDEEFDEVSSYYDSLSEEE